MRFSIVLLSCSMLLACGKTGALYLPEEPPAPPERNEQAQNEEPQNQDTSSSEKAD